MLKAKSKKHNNSVDSQNLKYKLEIENTIDTYESNK